MICCSKEKLEQKLSWNWRWSRSWSWRWSWWGRGGKTTKNRFWRTSAAVFTFSLFDGCLQQFSLFLIFDGCLQRFSLFCSLLLKTCLVTKRVAVRAFGAFPLRIAVIFHADADFEIKSGVDSYFWTVLCHFLGKNVGQHFMFFVYVAPHSYQQMLGL